MGSKSVILILPFSCAVSLVGATDACHVRSNEAARRMGPWGRPIEVFTLEHPSHRRCDSVETDTDAVGFHRAVVFLHCAEDDDLGARLQFGLVT